MNRTRIVLAGFVLNAFVICSPFVFAEKNAAPAAGNKKTYLLRYKFAPGEVVW